MQMHMKRLLPLVLVIPLLACSVFERLIGEEPTPLPAEPPTAESPEPLPATIEVPAEPPGPAGWPCYSNEWAFPFTVCYPPDALLTETPPDMARVDLAIEPGTNLSEKWLDIYVTAGVTECSGPLEGFDPPETVVISGPFNDLDFLREAGGDAGAGNYYQWVSYSTMWGDTCVSLMFTLHSTNPLNYDPPIPEFDQAAESAVFDMILATFYWWG